MQYPIVFNHIGLSVSNIEKAIEFYKEVFGWFHLAGPWPIKRTPPRTDFTDTVYGTDWTGFKLAHMSAGNGIGIELLEFEDNYPAASKMEMKRQGLFHFGILTTDLREFVKNVEAHGGKQHSDFNVREVNGQKREIVFVEDPFGNVIEAYNYSYEIMAT
jgi:Lactoylglutathione lyase and related lyases